MNPLVRGLLTAVLGAGALGFLAISACAGFVTLMALDIPGRPFLVLSLPCLVGGLALAWCCAFLISGLPGGPRPSKDRA